MAIPYRYRILGLSTIAAGLIAYFGRGAWIVDAFAANVAAGLLGALFTIVFVDRAAEHRREQERRRVELMAMRHARVPLVRMAELFFDIIKAASVVRPRSLTTGYCDVFAASETDQMDWLRLDAPSRVVGHDWYVYIDETLSDASDQLQAIADRYLAHLNLAFVERLDVVLHDDFVTLLRSLKRAHDNLVSHGLPQRFSLNGTKPLRDPFFKKLLELIACYEATAGAPLPMSPGLGRDDVLPKYGSARLERLPAPIQIADAPPRQLGQDHHYLE